MKLRLEDKKKAIELRLQGKTFGEIREIIPNLSKSTLSGWLSKIRLSKEQENQLRENIEKAIHNGRAKAGLTKRLDKQERVRKIIIASKKECNSLIKNTLFLSGIIFYWAEGNKKTEFFQFTNSDYRAIKLMMKWLTEICSIPKDSIKIRLYIHKLYSHENCEDFWAKITDVPKENFQKTVYKPTIHKIKKNPEYKGCVQLRVLKRDFYWKVMGWIEGISDYYNLNMPL